MKCSYANMKCSYANIRKIFLFYILNKRIMKKSCMEKTALLKCLYFVSVGEDVLRKVPDGGL
jgi:hypothetical protein